ncbi:hypothetical protein [Streptomyces cacaoi]|uniref:hypothetical protein n=1 Tax=Streptomyces cacaoi TaxID=1898 RepID=UPI00374A862F
MRPVVEVRFHYRSHLLYAPGPATGPHPVPVQISGHGIEVRVRAPEEEPVVVRTLGFTVDAREPARDGDVVHDVSGSVPSPQIRVWLDEPQQMAPGPVPVAFPVTVPAAESTVFTLTAHTRRHDIRWHLGVSWTCGEEEGWARCPVRTTCRTGMVAHHPDGSVTENARLHAEPDPPKVAAEAESTHRAAAGSGDVEAMFRLGVCLAERGAHDEAQRWFQEAAEAGHATAAESVAWLLDQQGEHAEAAVWYRRAAALGGRGATRHPR